MRFSSAFFSLLIGLLSWKLLAMEPLFESSHTYQELLKSGACCQILTLRRHDNGQRACGWKIEGLSTSKPGSLLFFTEEGQLLQEVEGYFENEQFISHGRWTYFNAQQKPLLIASFQRGSLEGEMLLFSKEGLIRTRKNFSKGLLHGLYAHFNERGKIIEQGSYEKGLLSGSIWRFDSEGEIIEEIPFHQGLPHGLCLTLDYQNHRQLRRYYFFGFLHRMDGPALERIRPDQSHELSASHRWGHPYGTWVYKDKDSKPYILMEWKSPRQALAYYKANPSHKWHWRDGFLQPSCEIESEQKSQKLQWKMNSASKTDSAELHYWIHDQLIEASYWKKQKDNSWKRDGLCKRLNLQKHVVINELWEKGSLTQKELTPILLEKRSSTHTIRLYRKADQVTLEFQDPKHETLIQARFNENGSMHSLESTKGGWQRFQSFDSYQAAEEFVDWIREGDLLTLCYKDPLGTPKERFLFEKGSLLQHCLWKNHKPEGDWSQKGTPSQPKEELFFKKGKREGLYRLWHSNGTLAYEGFYQDGVCNGLHTSFHESGKVFLKQEYEKGKAQGKREVFTESGALILKAHYQNDLLNGPFWHKLSHGQVIEAEFIKGHLDGVFKAYYATSATHSKPVLAFEGHYKKGKRAGVFNDYHESAQLLRKLTYQDNLLEGQAFGYHLNGQKALEAFFHQGKKEGCWKQFNDRGILVRLMHFKEGLQEGEEKLYDDKGLLLGENHYVKDLLDGAQKRYDLDGCLIYEANYVEGKLHGAVRKYQKKQNTWIHSRFDHGELIEKQTLR